jgi:hypothetical protein
MCLDIAASLATERVWSQLQILPKHLHISYAFFIGFKTLSYLMAAITFFQCNSPGPRPHLVTTTRGLEEHHGIHHARGVSALRRAAHGMCGGRRR